MKYTILGSIVTICLIILAVLLLNPFQFWMPDMMVMVLLALTLALFGVFAIFILRENSEDEREAQHRALAGRNAFLAGSGILTLGIVIQGYVHQVDPWLVGALIVMVITKFVTRLWSDRNL